jgi:hypothetical protein
VRAAALASGSIKEALGRLGLRAAGGTYRAFHEACERFGIDAPLCQPVPPHGRRWEPVPDAEVFRVNSTFLNRGQIKARLIRSGVPERCAVCALGPEWQGYPLSLQLDHTNGVFNDNRRENLRLLCPNCHSQTETYGAKSPARSEFVRATTLIEGVPCLHCTHPNRPSAQRCSGCRRWLVVHSGRSKIAWPDDAELLRLVSASTLVAVGRQLGVSDTAVRKRLRARGLAA